MDLGLQGKRALVAGSSRGLGYATARLLALEGCHVAINSRNPQSLAEAAEKISTESGTKAYPIPGDVSDSTLPDQLIRQSVEALGGLDLLLTNSGGPP